MLCSLRVDVSVRGYESGAHSAQVISQVQILFVILLNIGEQDWFSSSRVDVRGCESGARSAQVISQVQGRRSWESAPTKFNGRHQIFFLDCAYKKSGAGAGVGAHCSVNIASSRSPTLEICSFASSSPSSMSYIKYLCFLDCDKNADMRV